MDWGFLSIFNKADFNTLILSCAIAGWTMICFWPCNMYLLGVSLLCTVYCILRIIVYFYKLYQAKLIRERNILYEQEQRKEKDALMLVDAKYAFDRLSVENQQLLYHITQKGIKSSYSDAYILKDKIEDFTIITRLQDLLYSDSLIVRWIEIDETNDSYSIYIKTPMNKIVEQFTPKS